MAIIMMSMMGWNASGSIPNDGIEDNFTGTGRSSEQCNNGRGGDSNTQE